MKAFFALEGERVKSHLELAELCIYFQLNVTSATTAEAQGVRGLQGVDGNRADEAKRAPWSLRMLGVS